MLVITKKALLVLILAFLVLALGPGFSFAITWTPNLTSSTHTVSQSSTSTSVRVTWDAMTPTEGYEAGSYTYVWDNTSNTEIEATLTPSEDISGNVTACEVTRTLSSNTWYFHIRAVDTSGVNWTDTQHFGPIIINTTPAPTVTRIEPASGLNSSDTKDVTITGTNFKKLDGSAFTSVTPKIGTTALTGITVVSSTSITATYAIKNKTAGSYDVTVTTDWGTSQPLISGFTVTNPAPSVDSISPTSASNAADREVTITGTGFLSPDSTPSASAKPTVWMKDPVNSSRDFALTNVTWVSKLSLTATVPASKTPGTYDVVVTNADSLSGTKADLFQVKYPAPTIASVSPLTGTNDSTTTITITGTGFYETDTTKPQVTLEATGRDTIECTSESYTNATEMTAVVPSSKVADTYTVKVTNPDSQFTTSTAVTFQLKNPAPSVDSISPTSASNAADREVTITGTGFLSTESTPSASAKPTVWMKDPVNSSRNFELSNVTWVSKTSLTATVPSSKTPGTYDVVVTNADSLSGTKADLFQVKLPAPTIASVSPNTGTNEKTTSITIAGTGFYETETVKPQVTLEADGKDTIECTSESVTSATEMTAVVPSNKAIATYTVKVTNPDSQFTTSTAVTFAVTNPVATVTSISPASMTNDGSQPVTIEGTNFRTGATVKVGTTSCTGVSLDSETPTTKLGCTVPAGIAAGTYNVTVTNVGAEAGTLESGFTVNSATTTVGLAYSASDTDHVPAGSLTITATFTASQSAAPTISIDQAGSEDITDEEMTATTNDKIWTYVYTVYSATEAGYEDGAATVSIKSSTGTSINITSGSSFTIDTVSLSAQITYAQGDNTSGPFKTGTLTITATLSSAQESAPKISINQQGSTDITDENMSGSGTSWTCNYTIVAKDGTTYKDGTATVTLKTSADASITIGGGGTFIIDTTPPTVALTYAQGSNTTGPFKAGTLTITATLSENPGGTPQIAIAQQGGTNISATDMTATGSAKVWTYPYTIHAATEEGYADGVATATITSAGDAASNPNAEATNNTFIIDTVTTVTIDTVTTPTNTNSQVITGTKESGATVAVAVTSPVTAGTVTYPSAATWQCTVSSLQEQANSITATATDIAGNTAEAETSVTYDGTAPKVTSATYVDTTHVDVLFSEAVSGGTTKERYTISGLTISSVADQGSNTYRLTTSEMTAGQTYTIVVGAAMTDVAGNAMDSENNSAQYTTGIKGDVNNSGTITPADASAAFQLYLTTEWSEMTGLERYTADFNESESVTPADASAIFQQYLNQ